MNITLITFYGKGSMLGIAEKLANEFSKKDKVTVIVPKGAATRGFSKKVSVRKVEVPESFSMLNLLKLPKDFIEIPKIARIIDESCPDIIHFINNSPWLVCLLPFLRGYKKVMTLHNPKPHLGESQKRHDFGAKKLAKVCGKIMVYGKYLKRLAISRGYSADKLRIVSLGDPSGFDTKTKVKEKNDILFFGRIEEYKGLKYLIKAEPLIKSDVSIVVAGKGNIPKEIFNNKRFMIINKYISDKEAAKLFKQSKIIVLPYVEAMQSGIIPIAYALKKPIIATRVGALPEVIDNGKTGLLVKPRNPEELAKAIDKVMGDPGLRKRLGSNGYKKLNKEMNWKKIAEQTKKVYREAIR